MIKKKIFYGTLLIVISYLQAFPWGQKGHDTVCFIAENHLTSVTKNAVESLLDGKSIVYYANWLDNASNTPEYEYSKTWHYKNIDADETYETAALHENGDIVKAIREQVTILTNLTSTKQEQSLALKMVIHLLGDIHQPMHMGHRSDLGGNKWKIKYFNAPTNLHSAWDSKLIESAHKWSYTEWQNQLDRVNNEEELEIIAEGTPEKWGKECYEVASKIYSTTPPDQNVSYDYIAEWTPIIEQQLLRGGLRLADLLNSIFDPRYRGANLLVIK